MAARLEPAPSRPPEIIDLRRLAARQRALRGLLAQRRDVLGDDVGDALAEAPHGLLVELEVGRRV